MRTILAIAAAFALAACGATGPDMGQSADQCRYGSRPFIEAWPCVRETFATRQDNNPGIQAAFLAKGDLIWQRAKEGKISEAEARAEIRLAAADAHAAEDRNAIGAGASDALVMSRMQPYAPPPMQPTQTIIMPSGRMMNCTFIGTVTNCY